MMQVDTQFCTPSSIIGLRPKRNTAPSSSPPVSEFSLADSPYQESPMKNVNVKNGDNHNIDDDALLDSSLRSNLDSPQQTGYRTPSTVPKPNKSMPVLLAHLCEPDTPSTMIFHDEASEDEYSYHSRYHPHGDNASSAGALDPIFSPLGGMGIGSGRRSTVTSSFLPSNIQAPAFVTPGGRNFFSLSTPTSNGSSTVSPLHRRFLSFDSSSVDEWNEKMSDLLLQSCSFQSCGDDNTAMKNRHRQKLNELHRPNDGVGGGIGAVDIDKNGSDDSGGGKLKLLPLELREKVQLFKDVSSTSTTSTSSTSSKSSSMWSPSSSPTTETREEGGGDDDACDDPTKKITTTASTTDAVVVDGKKGKMSSRKRKNAIVGMEIEHDAVLVNIELENIECSSNISITTMDGDAESTNDDDDDDDEEGGGGDNGGGDGEGQYPRRRQSNRPFSLGRRLYKSIFRHKRGRRKNKNRQKYDNKSDDGHHDGDDLSTIRKHDVEADCDTRKGIKKKRQEIFRKRSWPSSDPVDECPLTDDVVRQPTEWTEKEDQVLLRSVGRNGGRRRGGGGGGGIGGAGRPVLTRESIQLLLDDDDDYGSKEDPEEELAFC